MASSVWRQLAIASNWPILAAVAVLSAVGVVSIWADNPPDGQKQLLFLAVSCVILFLFQTMSYVRLGQYAWPFYAISLILLLYTLLPGVPGVREVKGAKNWISFGAFKLQPAELMKVAFCCVMARYLRFRSNYRTLGGLVPPFLLAIVPLLLILKQPDLGTALIFVPALFVMLFVAGAKLRHIFAVCLVGGMLAPVAWYAGSDVRNGAPDLPVLRHLPTFVKKYQRERVRAMFTKDASTLQDTGYQQAHSLMAFGSGGWFGRGPGNIQAGRQIPEAHNDMIFALVGEQFGFAGAAVVMVAYLVLFVTGLEIAGNTREPFGRLVAVGIVSLLAGQTFLNLLVCLRLMPVTGVTLPFVSYGGSSLVASFISVALLLNIGQNRPVVIAGDSFEYD